MMGRSLSLSLPNRDVVAVVFRLTFVVGVEPCFGSLSNRRYRKTLTPN